MLTGGRGRQAERSREKQRKRTEREGLSEKKKRSGKKRGKGEVQREEIQEKEAEEKRRNEETTFPQMKTWNSKHSAELRLWRTAEGLERTIRFRKVRKTLFGKKNSRKSSKARRPGKAKV